MKLPVPLHVTLAIAGLSWLSNPASAQPAPDPIPTFEVYGTLVPFTEVARTTDATKAADVATDAATQVGAAAYTGLNQRGRFVMDPGTSNLGFRGGVEIMKDLSVLWQVESGVPVDGNASANTVGSRNTYLGLTGSWGTAFFGNWDTPYKYAANSTIFPLKAGLLFDYNAILHTAGFGASAVTSQTGRANTSADTSFFRRQGNAIQYWTPNLSGFTARFLYSPDEGRTNPTATVPGYKPQVLGVSLLYDQGPIKLRYSFEGHIDHFAMAQMGGSQPNLTNKSSFDMGHEVIAQFTNSAPDFDTRIVGVFEFLSYGSDDSTVNMMNPNIVKSHTRPAFYALIEQQLPGKHRLWASYGQALEGGCELVSGGDCSTSGLGSNMITVGYIYRFSRTTDFWVTAYQLANDKSASYTQSPGLGGVPTAPGADIQGVGIGFLHSFSWKTGGPPKAAPPPPPPPPVAVEPAPAPAPAPAADTPPPPAAEPTPPPAPKP